MLFRSDGVDIKDVTLNSLRRQIGIVPQETIMFSGTIAGNIAFGQNEFDMEAVEEAAKVANAHDFISQMPDGYYTVVGERGAKLSGGQRQRVAVGRALVNKPSIILADEPTGNLDSKTGTEIMALFDQIHAAGNTVIMVTHEEDIAAHAKRVIRLRDGIIESDTFNN